jgi:rod shape-determining protein MreC
LLPFNEAIRRVSDAVVTFKEDRRMNGTLQEENRRLKEELDALRSAEYRLGLLEAENKELLAMAGYRRENNGLTLLSARVLGVSLGDMHESFFLDKGEEDGVRPDMVVTTSSGVAGVVDQVYRHYSRFMLISARRSRMGVKVLRRESRAAGVLTGQGPNRSLLQAEYFGRDDDVKPGDMLVTSGIGGKYPSGLFIGTVSAVESDVTGLQKLVQVDPAANLSHLDRVFIVLQEDIRRKIENEIADKVREQKSGSNRANVLPGNNGTAGTGAPTGDKGKDAGEAAP